MKRFKLCCVVLAALMFVVLAIGCASYQYVGMDLSSRGESESEIIVTIGTAIYTGRYSIFLDGELRNSMKRKGGIVKYIVPNGNHVVSVQWEGTYGTPDDRASIQIEANSNRTMIRAKKPADGNRIEIVLEGVSDILR